SRRRTVGLYQGGQFWTQFYTRLIAGLEGQLEGLRESEDYSATLYLAYGQAYLLAKRPREAWVIFERLARDSNLSLALQATAHYRWILAAIEVGVWEDAFRIAEGFGHRFPESSLVPDALFLLANAYQNAGQYNDAIDVFSHFMAKHSEHSLAPRVLFARGYNYKLMNLPVEARRDFENFTNKYPQHDLLLDARFWRALTFFAERNYEHTLEALTSLESQVKGGRLEPEVVYRLAATQYAKGDYDEALVSIKNYLTDYPNHLRVNEGRVLLGDIEMGRGNLDLARSIFCDIAPSAGHLFTYSIFQVGKIDRAMAGAAEIPEVRTRYLKAHLEHFQTYLDRDDVPQKSRISDALYWAGWTHVELGNEREARGIFDRALYRHGDDPEAGEVINIIDALARIEKRLNKLSRRDRDAELKTWIEDQKAIAFKSDRLTYYARLNLYLQSMVPPDEPTSLVFDTVEKVPLDNLDAQSLGVIATTLVDRYSRVAEDYLERLEERYADSPYRSYAYYARAYLFLAKQDYEAARILLARFHAESPMHPLSIQANLLYAESLTHTARYETATNLLEDLLKRRDARGRPHAEALLALSSNEEAAGNIKRAVPYAQRVFNVYRAYPELAGRAYLMSAQQLEKLGDIRSAYLTLAEMLTDERVRELPLYEDAITLCSQLEVLLPEETDTPAVIEKITETGGSIVN
ncbi:MAG: tetratricopeptide repeat protein, partial [Verrucomicrobiota bacterium]|nr:tetratricopeptide repeat protein [Verrucomicrobiota bacterium]